MVALPGSDEQDLIRIAHDLVVPDVPDEETAIRQTDLKVGGEALLRLPQTHPGAAQVFHEPDA